MQEITDFEVSGSDPEPTPPPVVEAPPVTDDAAVAPPPTTDISADAAVTPDDAEGDEPQERDEHGKFKPKKNSPQARIDRITFEREEAKREAAALRAERDRVAAELAQLRTPKAPEPQAAAPAADEPKLEDFDTYEKWVKASIQYEAKRLAREEFERRDADAQKAKAREQFTQRQQAFQTQLTAARQKYSDWDAVASAAEQQLAAAGVNQLPPVMIEAILSSSQGAELMRDLALHPSDAIQLARENVGVPVSAAPLMRSLLERRLATPAAHSGPAAPPVRTVAPRPIKPVGAGPVITDAIPADDADLDTHMAYWNKRDRDTRR